MPIKVVCKCGAQFTAKDALAGKAVKCPKCSQPLRIPSPPAQQQQSQQLSPQQPQQPQLPAAPAGGLGGLLDDIGFEAPSAPTGPKCPSCGEPVPPNAIICVKCGFNSESGQRMHTMGATTEPSTKGMSAAEKMVAKAAKDLQENPAESKDFGDGAAAYLITIGMILASGMAIGLGFLALALIQIYVFPMADPTDATAVVEEDENATLKTVVFVIELAGLLAMALAWVDVVGTALSRSTVHGVLCLMFPKYAMFYAIIFSGLFARAILLYLIGTDLQILGFLLFYENGISLRPDSTRLLFFLFALVGLNLAWFGWAIITGMAFAEKTGGVLHGALCLLVPGYAHVFGIFRRNHYITHVVLAFAGGIIYVVCMGIAISRLQLG